jgi:hypothetical protein
MGLWNTPLRWAQVPWYTYLGSESASEISRIPLSVDTISRRVIDMYSDIEAIMKEKINSSQKFSLQIDESTDISGHAQLLA